LDQDSIVPDNMVREYNKYINSDNIGMLCPLIHDINTSSTNFHNFKEKIEFVEECIASASAIRISAWLKIGGYAEEMFIDKVDFDICKKLRHADYKILRLNNVVLLHEVGHSILVKLFGKQYAAYFHSPIRCYYMIRNYIYLGKHYDDLLRNLVRCFKRFLIVNIYEDNRLEKDKMMFIGFWHGIIGRYGKY
jgi:rhamnosyltransferase